MSNMETLSQVENLMESAVTAIAQAMVLAGHNGSIEEFVKEQLNGYWTLQQMVQVRVEQLKGE